MVVFGGAAVALGARVFTIPRAPHDPLVWPQWHNCFRYLVMRDEHFEMWNKQVFLLWGTAGIDRSHCRQWDQEDLGTLRFDEAFDAADPAAQVALLDACVAPLRNPKLKTVPRSQMCVPAAFDKWLRASYNLSLPLPRDQFHELLPTFLSAQPQYVGLMSFAETADGGWRIQHMIATYRISIPPHGGASTYRGLYDEWQAQMASLNTRAPPAARHAIQSARTLWLHMALEEVLWSAVKMVVAFSVVVGFGFVLLATGSLAIALLCVLTVCATIATWLGLAEACGILVQGVGMIESLVMMVSVGLMLDPICHVAFAYSEARHAGHVQPQQRLSYALSTIGISVLAGAVSTVGACAVLFKATIVLFSQFASLFCSLMILALVFTNCFLAPLLILFGPSSASVQSCGRKGGAGGSPARRRCIIFTHPWIAARVPSTWLSRGADPEPTASLRAADAAATTAIVDVELSTRHELAYDSEAPPKKAGSTAVVASG